ncbi:hypothetical protein Salat_0882900, partial [Sesamum alatum]
HITKKGPKITYQTTESLRRPKPENNNFPQNSFGCLQLRRPQIVDLTSNMCSDDNIKGKINTYLGRISKSIVVTGASSVVRVQARLLDLFSRLRRRIAKREKSAGEQATV